MAKRASSARRRGRGIASDAAHQGAQLLAAVELLCERLLGVTAVLERIGNALERRGASPIEHTAHPEPSVEVGRTTGDESGEHADDVRLDAAVAGAGNVTNEAPAPWTFDKLFSAARDQILGNPPRVWTAAELCQTLRLAGAKLATWRGVPGKLVARLRAERLVEAREGGGFCAHVEPRSQGEHRAVEAADGSAPSVTAPSMRSAVSIPWDAIVRAAQQILLEAPSRAWRWAELARAVRDSGVVSPTWKGIHIGLGAKLEALGLIEHVDEHTFKAKAGYPAVVPSSKGTATAEPEASPLPVAVEQDGVDKPAAPVTAGRPDSVIAVADEVDALGSWLSELPGDQRTAQVATWAGRLRRLHDGVGKLDGDEVRRIREEMRPLLGRLVRLTKELGTGWVDALSSSWETDDWDAYVEFQEAVASGREPQLARDQLEVFHRDRVHGLFIEHRRSAKHDAPAVLREALRVLPDSDAIIAKAIQRFGRPIERRAESAISGPPFRRRTDAVQRRESEEPVAARRVPDEVLCITRGKRALVAGGQGSREAHRLAIERSLQFEKLEWVFGERGKASHFRMLEERMHPGRYDLVLLLTSHSGHNSNGLVDACRTARVPLVYLARGYSVTSVVDAIRRQLVSRDRSDAAT